VLMDKAKLEALRARYGGNAAPQSQDPALQKGIDNVFAGSDRRPKPYAGIATPLGAAPGPRPAHGPAPAGRHAGAVGVPLDPRVPNRAGARLGPRAVRAIERIGPYHHVHRFAPLMEAKVADIGDVPFRTRFSLEASHEDIQRFFAQVKAAGVVPLSV